MPLHCTFIMFQGKERIERCYKITLCRINVKIKDNTNSVTLRHLTPFKVFGKLKPKIKITRIVTKIYILIFLIQKQFFFCYEKKKAGLKTIRSERKLFEVLESSL